jgi:hypothetical protein
MTKEVIKDYINGLEQSLISVPSILISYDETSFTEDVGLVEVIVKREMKHPERSPDISKCSASVMVTAAAYETVLPPCILY